MTSARIGRPKGTGVTPPAIRFWNKVNKDGPLHPILQTQCWEWTASIVSGYGQFGLSCGQMRYAHRYAWELAYGDIPEGQQVLHHCDNKRCCRIEHLFLGTQDDNMKDCKKKGRNVNPAKKLSIEQVLEIRAFRSAVPPLSLRLLAEQYGVRESTISRIATGVRWGTLL